MLVFAEQLTETNNSNIIKHNRVKNPTALTIRAVDSAIHLLNNWGQGPVSRKSRQLFGPEIKYSNQNIKNENAGPG